MTNAAEIIQFPRREDVDRPEPERSGRGPQVEDGYTRIANELLEQVMAAPLTLREMRVVMAVIRLTYGWNRKQARVTAGLLAKLTGLPSTKASQALAALVAKKVVIRHGGSRSAVSFNKYADQWDLSEPERKTPPPKQAKGDTHQTGNDDPKRGDSYQNGKSQCYQNGNASKDRKDNLLPNGSKNVDANTSSAKRRLWGEPIDHELAEWMAGIVDALPGGSEKRNLTRWANTFRLMREQDGREPEHIKRLFDWASQDSFWQSNILSPTKLRKQWKALAIQFNNRRKGGSHADRSGFDEKRANQDRIAAMLADPNDSSWIDGLFEEEEPTAGVGEPSVHATGGDLSQDVENVVLDGSDVTAGQAGGRCFDGEVVGTADPAEPGRCSGTHQSRGERVASECGTPDCELETATGGLWDA